MSEGPFLQSLATIMVAAGLVAVVFSRFKWPKAIGYILVGVVLNEHTWGGSFLSDPASVQTIGQLGVVFLMFTMGLEFSVSSMKKIGHVAMPTALLDTVVMVWLGFTIARSCFGWSMVPSLFLGAAICDSATTLLAKVIGEMKWSDRPFVRYVLGSSVCEDILCIGIIALVSGVASGDGISFASVGKAIGGVGVFFGATIVFGMVFVPKFLNAVARRQDDETLLVALLGCCFLVAYMAYKLDFSLALGAFLVGVLGASSDARARIHQMVMPLRSTFAAVFFVSIGLMVDPSATMRHLPEILLLSGVVIWGKFVNCFAGTLLTGAEGLKTSVQVGFSMAQIGEFAFMVALLYHSYRSRLLPQHQDWGAEDPFLPIVVGVTLLTTLLNPWLIRLSEVAGNWAETYCPSRLQERISAYRGFLARYRRTGNDERRAAVRANLHELIIMGLLQFALAIAFVGLTKIDWSNFSRFFEERKQIFFCLIFNILLIMALPQVLALARSLADGIANIVVGKEQALWQEATRRVVRLVVRMMVLSLDFVEIVMININIMPDEWWARTLILALLALSLAFGWRFFVRASRLAADNFREAMAADARLARLSKEVTFMLPGDEVGRLTIPEGSPAAGESVVTLDIRAKTGAFVIAVERNGKVVRNVGAEFVFAAGDKLTVLGGSDAVGRLRDLIGEGGK